MSDILLVTLNARYSHASLGLRYLYANMGALQSRCEILEFVIGARTESMAERILVRRPRIVGFGVYIWNVGETTRLVSMLARVAPDLRLVVGRPEVSHETGSQRICREADFVIAGPADVVARSHGGRIRCRSLPAPDGRAVRARRTGVQVRRPHVQPEGRDRRGDPGLLPRTHRGAPRRAAVRAGFDRLHALGPHEIQVGILKRLRGAPIARHTEDFGLRFNPDPPYNVLATDLVAFATMQRIARFARHWDLVANSGRSCATMPVLLTLPAGPDDGHPAQPGGRFERFMAFSDWLAARTDDSMRLSADRLYEALHEWLVANASRDRETAGALLTADYVASGLHGRPALMRRGVRGSPGGSGALRRQARFAEAPGDAIEGDDRRVARS